MIQEIIIPLVSLIALEIILGIDNLILFLFYQTNCRLKNVAGCVL